MTDTITCTELDTAARSSFMDKGYCVVRGLFSPEEVRAMAGFDVAGLKQLAIDQPEHAHRLQFIHCENGDTTIKKIEGVYACDPETGQWAHDPRLLQIAETLMGEPARLFKDKYILKPKNSGGFGAHQDMGFGFHRFIEGAISMMIAIDPADEENGCLQVASVQHTPTLMQRHEMGLDSRLIPEHAWQSLPLQPGDVAIFDGLTPHRSAANESERMRRVYITTYHRASEGPLYDDYYRWYFDWQAHCKNGGQRNDYCGEPARRSKPVISSFANTGKGSIEAY